MKNNNTKWLFTEIEDRTFSQILSLANALPQLPLSEIQFLKRQLEMLDLNYHFFPVKSVCVCVMLLKL